MKKFDQIVNDIRNEEPLDQQVEGAASRVRAKLFLQSAAAPERIRNCADYQALIPSYLNKKLSAGRALLLQDHTRECVACRHALNAAREGSVPTLVRPVTPPSHTIPKIWAMAAMLAVTVGLGGWLAVRAFMPGGSTRVTVQNVNGVLYAVSDRGSTAIFPGHDLREGEHVRTAKLSTAVLRLGDGSLVEVNERSEVAVTHASTGATIHLNRGDVIIQAAKQRRGTLDVLTPDCVVSVKGTVFTVSRGIKGSRVAVIEGSVKVAQGAQVQMLKPGDEVATAASMGKVPVQETVAWSKDSAKYLALLSEFAGIQKQLEAVPSPGLRYNSKLIAYAPHNAVLYASIPNLGPTLNEANRLLKDRLQQSEVLRNWWADQNNGAKIDEVLQKFRAVSDYLGDEVVLTIGGDWNGKYTGPMLLAEVKRPGLKGYLESELRQASGNSAGAVQLMDLKAPAEGKRPSAVTRTKEGPMSIAVSDKLVAVAFDPQQLDDVAMRAQNGGDSEGDNGLLETVRHSYSNGVGYLLCVDMEQITRNSVSKTERQKARKLPTGLEAMRYLVVERKDIGGKTENQATLDFSGRRWGMAAWLAQPAPMGTLDFVSPNATLAVSLVLREPWAMVSDVFNYLRAEDPNFDQQIQQVYDETGVRLVDDLAKPLGGDFTFAIDGPLVPLPSWKVAVEVYDPARLQWGIEQLVNAFNTHSTCTDCKLTLNKEDANGRTYYTLTSAKVSYEIDYVFVDGYLLAAPSRTLLNTAIQNRQTGLVLARSEGFRSVLPTNGPSNLSGLIYHNLGTAVAPMVKQLGSVNGVTDSQRASLDAFAKDSGPGLIYIYGEDTRITVASQGSFFGLNLNTLALPQLMAMGMHGGHTRQIQ